MVFAWVRVVGGRLRDGAAAAVGSVRDGAAAVRSAPGRFTNWARTKLHNRRLNRHAKAAFKEEQERWASRNMARLEDVCNTPETVICVRQVRKTSRASVWSL